MNAKSVRHCYCPAGTQYFGNICWELPQRCNVRDIQGTFREHFKGKDFLKSSQWKSFFVLKVYDFIIANVDLLADSSNRKILFPEYSRNIPWISVSKIFQGYPRNIIRLWKCYSGVKKLKKLFCGLSCEIFNIGSLISWMFFWTLLKPFFI